MSGNCRKSEAGFLWVPCSAHEIPEYVKMGIDVYAAYDPESSKMRIRLKPDIAPRFELTRVTDDYRASKKALPKISRSHVNASFFAKVHELDIAEGGIELIGYVGNHGVYSTDRERGKYIGCNVYILGVGNGLYHKVLYVHREQTRSLLSLAKQAAAEYFRNFRRNSI